MPPHLETEETTAHGSPRATVTVVIPTFHRESLVVESIDSALRQAGVGVEVLVVDDSAESSARAAVLGIGDARVRYLVSAAPSGGPALARNAGIARAQGAFLLCLDDDDRLVDGALAALVASLARKPTAGVAIGIAAPFGDDSRVLRHESAYFERAAARLRGRWTRFDLVACLLFKDAPILNACCLIRSELARALGGYDPAIRHCEDAELFARAVRASGFTFVDRPVVHYRTGAPSRIHASGLDRSQVAEAYRTIDARYEARHGAVELNLLRVLAAMIA